MKLTVTKLTNFDAQIAVLTGRSWRGVVERELRTAARASGQAIRANVVAGIQRGRGAPIHPFTQTLRDYRGFSGSTPLVQSQTLLRNIDLQVIGLGVIVGVIKNLPAWRGRGPGGERLSKAQLAEVARLQEKGFRITVTPRMRVFFKARGLFIKRSTTELIVPARPFLAPAVAESSEAVKKAYLAATASIVATIKVKFEHASKVLNRRGA